MDIGAERLIMVSPARVMQALTNPDELKQWCCQEAEVNGDTYRLIGPSWPGGLLGGRLLVCSDNLLRFEWQLKDELSIVEISLVDEPQEAVPKATFTQVSVAHTEIPDGALNAEYQKGVWTRVWRIWVSVPTRGVN